MGISKKIPFLLVPGLAAPKGETLPLQPGPHDQDRLSASRSRLQGLLQLQDRRSLSAWKNRFFGRSLYSENPPSDEPFLFGSACSRLGWGIDREAAFEFITKGPFRQEAVMRNAKVILRNRPKTRSESIRRYPVFAFICCGVSIHLEISATVRSAPEELPNRSSDPDTPAFALQAWRRRPSTNRA